MLEMLKRNYGLTSYQAAQVRFLFLSLFSELSKLLMMGICFLDILPLYAWALFIFQIFRSSSGGFHCRTYWGCFAVSLGYMLLAIRVLPLLPVGRVFQITALFLCAALTRRIGPLTSVLHPVLSAPVQKHLKNKVSLLFLLYSVLLYIIPPNPYLTVGYWVIILNTVQLGAAKLLQRRDSE